MRRLFKRKRFYLRIERQGWAVWDRAHKPSLPTAYYHLDKQTARSMRDVLNNFEETVGFDL